MGAQRLGPAHRGRGTLEASWTTPTWFASAPNQVGAADNDKLRALEAGLNDLIRQDLPLRYTYVPLVEATAQHGLIRSRSVAPPPGDDGLIRIVEIVGLDRQACGGTHLASTARSRPLRILKIDNKGRHNRRIRIGLAG